MSGTKRVAKKRGAKEHLADKPGGARNFTEVEDFVRAFALIAKGSDSQPIVPLRETFAPLIGYQRTVMPLRRLQPQGAVEQKLACGGFEQVGSAHHFSNAHRGIIHHTGKLVRGHVVAPPDEEIPEISSCEELLRAEMAIVEGNGFSVRDTETPVLACRRLGEWLRAERTAGSGVSGLVIRFVRGAGGEREFAPRACAGVNETGLPQFAPGRQVKRMALALRIRRMGSANIRPLLPADSEPAQVFQHCGIELVAGPLPVEIVVAKDERSRTGASGGNQERSSVSQVQQTGGRRRQAAPV